MSMSRLYTLSTFSRQLSVLLSSGVSVIDSLNAIADRSGGNGFRDAIRSIRDDLKAGGTVSAAFEKQSRWFPPVYRMMVRVGELGGNLDVNLARLAAFLEKAAVRGDRLAAGTLVPAAIAASAAVVGLFLTGSAVYGMKAEGGAGIWMALAWITLGGIAAAVLGALTSPGRSAMLRLILLLPSARRAMEDAALARTTRVLATTIRSGVTILDALELAASTAGHPGIEHGLRVAKERTQATNSLTKGLKEAEAFPMLLVDMIGAGEETGKVDEMLLRTAEVYEAEADRSADRFERLIGTVLTFLVAIGMALLVQGLVLSRLAETVIR